MTNNSSSAAAANTGLQKSKNNKYMTRTHTIHMLYLKNEKCRSHNKGVAATPFFVSLIRKCLTRPPSRLGGIEAAWQGRYGLLLQFNECTVDGPDAIAVPLFHIPGKNTFFAHNKPHVATHFCILKRPCPHARSLRKSCH